MVGKTILLADDDDNDAMLLMRAFRKGATGVRLVRVKDGEEALAYLEGKGYYQDRAQFPFPEMVILDLKMPRRTGLELLEWLRSDERFKCLIAIVLTSSMQTIDVNQAYTLGANCYLVKPCQFERLLALCKSLTTFWLEDCTRPEIATPRVEPEAVAT